MTDDQIVNPGEEEGADVAPEAAPEQTEGGEEAPAAPAEAEEAA